MKQIILSILLITALLLGCTPSTSSGSSPVFYYPKGVYSFDTTDSVFYAEPRDKAYWDMDISNVIFDYLKGPENKALHNAFSVEVEVLECRSDKSGLHITLSASVADLAPMDMTIGLVALARTCFGFTDADTIYIHADSVLLDGEQKIVFTRDNILYWDQYIYCDPTTAPTTLPQETSTTQGE